MRQKGIYGSATSMSVRQRVSGEQAEAAPRHPGKLVPVEERRPGQPRFGTGVPGDPQQTRGHEHADDVVAALGEAGYSARVLR